jgi:hypothetical protein
MSETTRSFLDEYRNAGQTERLYLYLQYRELRSEFAQVEQDEAAHRQTGSKPRRTRIQTACKVSTWPLFRLMPGLERRCCR